MHGNFRYLKCMNNTAIAGWILGIIFLIIFGIIIAAGERKDYNSITHQYEFDEHMKSVLLLMLILGCTFCGLAVIVDDLLGIYMLSYRIYNVEEEDKKQLLILGVLMFFFFLFINFASINLFKRLTGTSRSKRNKKYLMNPEPIPNAETIDMNFNQTGIDKLEQIGKLRELGIINEAEFERLKKKAIFEETSTLK